MAESRPHDAFERLVEAAIRAGKSRPAEDFVRPSDATIETWMAGEATEEQKSDFMAALARSAEFREEMRDLAKAIDDAAQSSDVAPSPSPSRQEFLAQFGEEKPQGGSSGGGPGRLKITRFFIPLAAAALIVLTFLLTGVFRTAPQTAELELVQKQVDPGYLVSTSFRDPLPADSSLVGGDELEEVFARFRGLGTWQNGAFVTQSSATAKTYDQTRQIEVRFTDSTGTLLRAIPLLLPADAFDDRSTLWIMDLPARSLRKTVIAGDRIDLVWPNHLGRHGCLTVSRNTSHGLYVWDGITFDLR